MVENNQIIFKEASSDDLSFILDLYNYYLLHTTAIADYDKINMEELQTRFPFKDKKYKTFLVYDATGEKSIGFCALKQFSKKPAYDRTAEISLYLKPEQTGKKVGRSIVRYLEEYAKGNQIEVTTAAISGENTSSLKLFEKMGYERCAHFREIAIKFNRRIDLIYYEKIL